MKRTYVRLWKKSNRVEKERGGGAVGIFDLSVL